MIRRRVIVLIGLLLAGCAARDTAPVPDPWLASGQAAVQARLAVKPNIRHAKNVILFVGDGMGPTTVTAGRIFDGQTRGEPGEDNSLAFEIFPYTALVKTYNVNQQVPDSAGTASAMQTGIKTRAGVLGITGAARRTDCAEALAHQVPTLAETAEHAGKATGIVTTARITHATPAAVYAHTPEREWESDADMPDQALAKGCRSIARQFVEFSAGDGIDVVLGGGRAAFGAELMDLWRSRHPRGRVVEDRDQLAAIKELGQGRLLGLFAPSHLTYMLDRPEQSREPTLSEMTAKAIDLLSQHPDGYYLMVEGGRIDHGHHDGFAGKALAEVQELSRAVQVAVDKVDLRDTLILVTADHSHVLTMAGYPTRGNAILGLVHGNDAYGAPDGLPVRAQDGESYTTLGYANGAGAIQGPRTGPAAGPMAQQQALVPLPSETHGGEDVALYATGPWAHLASGVIEQHVIYHIITHAFGWSAIK